MADDIIEVLTEEVGGTNGLSVYQQDKASIDMQIVTAKRFPRNLKRCIDDAITIATIDEETAKSCHYSLVKGGKAITGPSVYLAKIIAQSLGNMRIENRVVGYDDTHVTCEATCFDLEKNFAVRTTIKKSLLKSASSGGGRVTEDMAVIIGNAGNSVALRNAVFAVVPKSITDKVHNAAKEKIAGKLSNENELTTKRTKIVDHFKTTYSSLGITDEDICRAVGKTAIAHIGRDEYIMLLGFENAIKTGDQLPENIFKNNNIVKPEIVDKSEDRLLTLIGSSKTKKDLEKYSDKLFTTKVSIAYDEKMKSFS